MKSYLFLKKKIVPLPVMCTTCIYHSRPNAQGNQSLKPPVRWNYPPSLHLRGWPKKNLLTGRAHRKQLHVTMARKESNCYVAYFTG